MTPIFSLRRGLTLALAAWAWGGACQQGIGAPQSQAQPAASQRAVVIVSGGDAVSPFTTPGGACRIGFAAGNTDTELRRFLLLKGHRVFTSPAMDDRGPVRENPGPDPLMAFADCPPALPPSMTVNSTGDIDLAGQRLAQFLLYLHRQYGIREVDLVGHSMGGLYSRAALPALRDLGNPVRIRSLTTLGTPWQGAVVGDYVIGKRSLADCYGNRFCELFLQSFKPLADGLVSGSGQQGSYQYLQVPRPHGGGWNQAQVGQLNGIPVSLIGGAWFQAQKGVQADPLMYPWDGLVSKASALAVNVSDSVLPHRRCLALPLTHSIFVSAKFSGKPVPDPADFNNALTWNPKALAAVETALQQADTALTTPNRQGCPNP